MPPITTIFFDMDNTLFDFNHAQRTACAAIAGSVGQADGDILFEKYFRSGRHGFESHENIRNYLADRSLFDEDVYHRARRIYEMVKLEEIVLYDGVDTTLSCLQQQGFTMGIITDAHSRDATRRLEKSRLFGYFDGIVTHDLVMARKESEVPFRVALDMLKTSPGAALVVGDSPHRDIRPAKNLGIRTVYAKYGDQYSATQECADADFTISRMDELLQVIGSLEEDLR